MTNKLKDLFIKEPNVNVLLHTYRNDKTWTSQIAVTQNMTRMGAGNKVAQLEKNNLLIKKEETNGRKPLTLTPQGEELAQEFERLVRVMEEVEHNE